MYSPDFHNLLSRIHRGRRRILNPDKGSPDVLLMILKEVGVKFFFTLSHL